MSAPIFTPGARSVRRFDEAQTVVIADGKLVGVFTGEYKEGNARLDAAAPKLYAALSMWQRFAAECEQRNVVIPLWAALLNEEAVNLTLAAMAEARGEQ